MAEKPKWLEEYEKCISPNMNPYTIEVLKSYLDDGFSEEQLIEALHAAGSAGVKNLNYIKAVLDNMLNGDYKTSKEPKRKWLTYD